MKTLKILVIILASTIAFTSCSKDSILKQPEPIIETLITQAFGVTLEVSRLATDNTISLVVTPPQGDSDMFVKVSINDSYNNWLDLIVVIKRNDLMDGKYPTVSAITPGATLKSVEITSVGNYID